MTAEERERWKKVEAALRNFDQRLAKIEKALRGVAGWCGDAPVSLFDGTGHCTYF